MIVAMSARYGLVAVGCLVGLAILVGPSLTSASVPAPPPRYWVRDQFDADLTTFPNRVRARGREPCPRDVISRAAEPAAASEQRQPVLQHLPGPSRRGNVVATRQRGHEPLWHGG